MTTTVAALVDRMNDGPPRSVITIEDPIEVLHADRECAISQREVGLDTDSLADGLAGVLRHDPDVVVVGALPDPATAELALSAAADGVLVVAATTAGEPGEAVRRLVALAPAHRQARVRGALASTARAVVHQRLVPRADGTGRRPEVEVVWGGHALHRLAAPDRDYGVPPAPLEDGSVRPAAIAVGSPAATSR